MRHRTFPFSLAFPLAVAIALSGLAFPTSTLAQDSGPADSPDSVESADPADSEDSADSAGWTVPRTGYGDPDLQGNWTNETLTPIQRPGGQENLVLSSQEVAELEARRAAEAEEGNRPSDPDRPPPPQGGFERGQGGAFGAAGPGTYNYVWTQKGDQIAVFNGEPRSSLIVDPPDGRRSPLTSEARERMEEREAFMAQFGPYDNPENRPLAERCILSFGSNAGPPMLPNYAYNNTYTIVQTPDHVAILTEMVHDVRIIRLGDAEPLPDHIRPWLGDSRGWWEGDTLVVETTNLHPSQTLLGIPPAEDLTVTERFTRADEITINYEFTVESRSTYTRPWRGELPFRKADAGLYEYACHEANYAMENVLSGARAKEREAQQEDRRDR